jgi:predicted nucleotidyltransferase
MGGIEVALINGFFAKHEETGKSDIDVLIIGKIDENRLLREISQLEKVLKREVNYSIFQRGEFNRKAKEKDPFISDLLKNPKIFLIGDENDL